MKNLFIFLTDCWKCTWKGVLTFAAVIAVIMGINSFFSSLATSAELDKVEKRVEKNTTLIVEQMEKKTDAQIQQFRKSMELRDDINRLNQVNSDLMRTKQQMRQYPRDKDFKEDYETLKADKEKIQKRIDAR